MKKSNYFFVALLFFCFVSANAQTEAWQIELLKYVNDLRTSGCNCGAKSFKPVTKLKWNEKLATAAYNHANDMNNNHYFEHKNLEGQSYGDRIEAADYNWKNCGENIAQGQKNGKEVFLAWKKSPTHCKNMMNKDFLEVGFGRKSDFWVQDFGTLFK